MVYMTIDDGDDGVVTRDSVEEVAEMLNHVRFRIRAIAGISARLGADSEIDRLIDMSIAPLVLIAGTGGFDCIEDAISVVGEDLRLAFSP